MHVAIATNHFEVIDAVIAAQGRPLLKVESDPLRVTVVTPDDVPSRRIVKVRQNVVDASCASDVRVLASDSSVSIFWGESILVFVVQSARDAVTVHIDLRTLGINVYSDHTTLHVGQMRFTSCSFGGVETAINLG